MNDQWLHSYRGKTTDGREVVPSQVAFNGENPTTCCLVVVLLPLHPTGDSDYAEVNTPGETREEAFSKAKAEVIKQFGDGGVVPEIVKG